MVKSLSRCHVASRERLTIIPHGVPYMTKLLRYFVSEDSIFLQLEHVQGGTLWSHLLSQPHTHQPGTGSGSSLEKKKAQLNARLNPGTPVLFPPGHTHLQDGIPLEPPRTSQSLTPAREPASIRPQREAEGRPSARTSTSCSLNLPKALRGRLHPQARQGPGQGSDSWALPWVRAGAGRVLGGCGQGRGQSRPSADGASPVTGRGAWSVQEEQVRQWAAEMLVALEALHEQGVLCRDLNPQNLLLDQAAFSGRTLPSLVGQGRAYKTDPPPQDLWAVAPAKTRLSLALGGPCPQGGSGQPGCWLLLVAVERSADVPCPSASSSKMTIQNFCPLIPPCNTPDGKVTSGSRILASGQKWSPSAAGRLWTTSTVPQRWVGFLS